MKRSSWDGVCLYLEGVFDRTLTNKQREVGWNMHKELGDVAVERAAELLAEAGSDRLPTWSLLFRTAVDIQQHLSEALPAPADADSLTEDEHAAAMMRLRARETPLQRARADAVVDRSRPLPMIVRLKVAADFLGHPSWTTLDPGAWDHMLEARIREEQQKRGELAL